jgi:pyruvate kinase
MRRLRRTKIVATLGPASGNPATIARLFEVGADVFRINMSHTTHDRMRELVGAIRDVERDRSRPVGILVDLQGPKLRVGSSGGAVMLEGRTSSSTRSRPGDATRRLPHRNLRRPSQPHTALDDGKIRLPCLREPKQRIVARVGGE